MDAEICCFIDILKVYLALVSVLYFGAEFLENYWMHLLIIDLSSEFQSFVIVEASTGVRPLQEFWTFRGREVSLVILKITWASQKLARCMSGLPTHLEGYGENI